MVEGLYSYINLTQMIAVEFYTRGTVSCSDYLLDKYQEKMSNDTKVSTFIKAEKPDL